MRLLDTNVIVYARGAAHSYRDPCRAILIQAEEAGEAYGVDVETLQELLDLYARRGERAAGVRIVEETLALFPDPFPISRDEVEETGSIVKAYGRLSARDAIHAAVVSTYRLEGIVSADRGFDRVAGLMRFDPLELAGA